MFKNLSLGTKTTIPGIVVAALVAVTMFFLISQQQKDLAVQDAARTAAAVSAQVAADRQIYTSEVVGKLKRDGLAISVENGDIYPGLQGAIPLPATFVHATSDVVNTGDGQTHTIDLLSLWNLNQVKGPRSDWEEHALRQVAENPDNMVTAVLGDGDDARLHAVTADLGSARACVSCHNSHPDSSKRDFRLGDVMGGLVVSLPMAAEFRQAQSNALRLTAFLLIGFIVLLFLQWYLVNRRLIRSLSELETAADQISMGNLDVEIVMTGKDEIGRLGQAFERMRTSLTTAMKHFDKGSR